MLIIDNYLVAVNRMKGRTMAYTFIDDGYPEADEYETNYIEFDASDPKKIRTVIHQVKEYLKNHRNDRYIHTSYFHPSFS